MSFRSLELSPHAGTRESRLSLVPRGPGSTLPETLQNMPVFRLWIGNSADLSRAIEDDGEPRNMWNTLLGVLVAVAVSGGFWAGVGFLVARLVR